MPNIYLDPNLTTVLGQPTNAIRYIGEPNLPRDIKQHRGNNLDTLRRFGSPVIIKHMYNDMDVAAGIAQKSVNMDLTYGQTRHSDPVSHGIGYASVELSPNEWLSPDGRTIVTNNSSPGVGYTQAPKYRGYGPGYLVYAILPDVAQDVFKLNEVGALIRVQEAQVQMGWFPQVSDNDLITICRIDEAEHVVETYERYLAKMTNPVSMRGLDRKGRRELSEDFGNRHIVDQWFEMALVPARDSLYDVEMDR